MKKRAEEWLKFADVDLRSAEKLIDDEYLTRAAAFHAHQCVEKSIKAVLEMLGKRVPKIHDLALLIEAIRTSGLNPSIDDDVLDEMNQVYIETRYPADFGFYLGELRHRRSYATSLALRGAYTDSRRRRPQNGRTMVRMPLIHGDLRYDDRRSASDSILEDFQFESVDAGLMT